MPDKTLASLTAATPAAGGLLYGTQGGADRKFTLSAAGAALMEAADAIKLDELASPTDVTTLNATTSTHGLLPKLGGGTTNFLRADGAWAAPAGDGEVNFSGQAWVDLVTGNNATAALGKPSRPYQTLQAAYDAGALTFNIGSGSYSGLTIPGGAVLSLIGVGRDKTVVSGIFSQTGFWGTADIRGNGRDNISIGNIILTAYAGDNGVGTIGANGGDLSSVRVSGFSIVGGIQLQGGEGGAGDRGFDIGDATLPGTGYAGGAGGAAATLYLSGCDVAGSVICRGGNGGSGGGGGSSTDNSWTGGDGGNGGNGGAPGQIIMERCLIQGYADCPASVGGSAGGSGSGTGPGASGADGTSGSVGSVGGQWSTINDATVTATTNYRVSLIGTTWSS